MSKTIEIDEQTYGELLAKNNIYAELMNEFCNRVERGEVRSWRTYSKFCEALGRENKLA
jgi:hypothetical protein